MQVCRLSASHLFKSSLGIIVMLADTSYDPDSVAVAKHCEAPLPSQSAKMAMCTWPISRFRVQGLAFRILCLGAQCPVPSV